MDKFNITQNFIYQFDKLSIEIPDEKLEKFISNRNKKYRLPGIVMKKHLQNSNVYGYTKGK